MEQLSLFIFYNFMFGTEKVICPKNSEGGWSGFGSALIWIDPNYFGSLSSNPNKIQTNDMVGGVIYFCQTNTVVRQRRQAYFFIFLSHLMSETASPLRRLTKVSEKAKMKASRRKNLQTKANASVESVSMSP